MRSLSRAIRDRLIPAALTAAGVTLLAAGLLHYGAPAQAGPIAILPSASAPASEPSVVLPSLPPLETSAPSSASPSPTTSPDPNRVATRIVFDRLGIDLPVIAQPDPSYPSCNVAMWLQHPELGQPGTGKAVYLYAHARTGMFLPLLNESRRNSGKAMVGMRPPSTPYE